jgi:hypothetical protein
MTDEILGSLDLLAEESDPGELSDQGERLTTLRATFCDS